MKKHLSILLSVALAVVVMAGMTVFAAAETAANTAEIVYGDANTDGAVNMKDVLTIRKYVAGLSAEIDLTAADTNGDGAVNMKDVLTVRKFVANLITVIDPGNTNPTENPTATAVIETTAKTDSTETELTATETETEPGKTSSTTETKSTTETSGTESTAKPSETSSTTQPSETKPTTAPTKVPENPETVFFGSYEQDGDFKNGKEPIEWIVLEEKDGTKLLLSRYVLDYRMQADHYREDYNWASYSGVREWLNDEFYDMAFSSNEKPYMLQKETYTKQLATAKNTADIKTFDHVSLLSMEELELYFDLKTDAQNNTYSESLLAEATPQAAKFDYCNTVDEDWYGFEHFGYGDEWMGKNTALWLLRTPGGGGSCDASFVSDSGIVSYDYLATFLGGIRPVILLSDEPYSFDETVCYPENASLTREVCHDMDGSFAVTGEHLYDANGNETSRRTYSRLGVMENWGYVYDWTYDDQGNMLSERYYNGITYIEEYSYDEFGRRVKTTGYIYDGFLGNSPYTPDEVSLDVIVEYAYDYEGDEVAYNYYDANGNLIKEYDYFVRNDDGTITVYYVDGDGNPFYASIYDADGYRIGNLNYNDDGTAYVCKYNQNGDMIAEWKQYADGTIRMIYEYEYNENGDILSYTMYDEEGNYEVKVVFTYDDHGNVVSVRPYNEDGSICETIDDYETYYDVVYTYTESGNIAKNKLYNKNGSLRTCDVYTYDEQGNLISRRCYYDEECTSVGWSWSCDFTYDENGNESSYRAYNYDGSVDWSRSWDVTYDENGNQTSERRYNEDESIKWEFSFDKTYDENGNRTSGRFYKVDGSKDWLRSWDETYDENGNQTRVRYYNEDGSVNWWNSWDATYDENGNRTSERYYNGDGSVDWAMSCDCTYDENGNQISERYYYDDGTLSSSWEATYDANGNQTSFMRIYGDGSYDCWYEYIYLNPIAG